VRRISKLARLVTHMTRSPDRVWREIESRITT
jgi:hypothetical protein